MGLALLSKLKPRTAAPASRTSPICLEFASTALRAFQCEPSTAAAPAKLIAASCVDSPRDLRGDPARRLEWQLAHLPDLLKSLPFQTRRAACVIPASQMFARNLQLQRAEGVTLDALVRGAVAGHLGVPQEALACRFIEAAETVTSNGSRTETVCLAASRCLIDRLMKGLAAARLEPVAIHPEVISTLAGLPASPEPTICIDLGGSCSKVLILHESGLVFTKTIPIGGSHLDALVASQLNLGPDAAHAHRAAMTEITDAPPSPACGAGSDAPTSEPCAGLALLSAGARQAARAGRPPSPNPATSPTPSTTSASPSASPVHCASAESVSAAPFADTTELVDSLTDEVLMCVRYHEATFPGQRIARALFVGGEATWRPLCQRIARALRVPAAVFDPLARITRDSAACCRGFDPSQPHPDFAALVGLASCPTNL